MKDAVARRFREVAPKADFVSLRLVSTRFDHVAARDDVLLPARTEIDSGAMVTIVAGGGMGYAATCDLSRSGIERAAGRALAWAKASSPFMVHDFSRIAMPSPRGSYATKVEVPWESVGIADKASLLLRTSAALMRSSLIVDRLVSLVHIEQDSLYLTMDGGEVHQRLHLMAPEIMATANRGTESQSRSFGSNAFRQGGLELLSQVGFEDAAPGVADEALELLDAENCTSSRMDLLLAPDQMTLQIHESIGHPLELDRILGDERNYAGRSFVTLDMLGNYQYGSELLNVAFDPLEGQLASYAFDDDGLATERTMIIERGKLLRALGGTVSQDRAGVLGVACARGNGWNRPPIDRMANLNVDPGDSTFDDLVSGVERGIFMRTNRSWSIDDSRNKFQFGCQWGRLIEDGKLGRVVKNPNYRGISSGFWRSLKGVGDASTFEIEGTLYCGKGEPNQIMFVGHASPVCLFGDVEVFGGEQ